MRTMPVPPEGRSARVDVPGALLLAAGLLLVLLLASAVGGLVLAAGTDTGHLFPTDGAYTTAALIGIAAMVVAATTCGGDGTDVHSSWGPRPDEGHGILLD